MEVLMCEATEEILSSPRNGQLFDVDDIFKSRSNSKKSPSFVVEDGELSSVAMLRKTILRSVQYRRSKLILYEDHQQARFEEFGPPSPKIEVKSFEEKPTYFPTPSSLECEEHQNSETVPESLNTPQLYSTLDTTRPSHLQNLLTNFKNKLTGHEPKTDEVKENVFLMSKNKAIVENGLKLARRTSTEKIFENCSTYNMVYPEIILPKKDIENLSPSGALSSGTRFHETDKNNENCKTNIGLTERKNSSGDLITLHDTIFTRIVYGKDSPLTEPPVSKRDNQIMSPEARESFTEGSSISTYSNSFKTSSASDKNENPMNKKSNFSGKSHQKNRRKSKKNKSKDPPVFECSKCGVFYHITSNKAMDMARCLHCDFWTSVEPVFLKREKQTWNTCCIC